MEKETIMECTDMEKLKKYGFYYAYSNDLKEMCYISVNGVMHVIESNKRLWIQDRTKEKRFAEDRKLFDRMMKDGMFMEVHRA